ncbi:UDP-N-acetylmuramoyl-L-alanyl-D-glutamate--2,6-diaminopimelate ligase [Candidatus Venteria ishoeyi]|uniref:UDP-N-acetylmuramoyl-L-alanyl-D-glutamate--2, 6-diaminopimelate ligase n=1 Tax=Candidatus Venteria ishoeyi TaxID=1899563 RepID=UPI0025A4E94C|nr:UDP-N-acetylmuramoyl-L-alanyl-D-glutamate--2,6-diaminopimelate ligase [Candidatus Venteria ishoeyi]MDM8547447.1 UDP-N-acetylmuramoyl-L-alanyl-D-glutamate--2,6-diaminopimelate ligase [Candidatus Venteria ishoeyi]
MSVPARKLSEIIPVPATYDRVVQNLTLDNRTVQAGDVFLACQGQKQHGRQYLDAAIDAGAVAALIEAEHEGLEWFRDIPCILVPNLNQRAAELAASFYGFPASQLALLGVTGTNGKTSVSHFIAQCLPPPCGLLGTTGYGIYGQLDSGKHTTPDPVNLQRFFAQLQQASVKRVVMEVSSHALDQNRLAGLHFEIAIFTNLSRDHLDYHGDMQQYGLAKQRLFHWPDLAYAIINIDDDFGIKLLDKLPETVAPLSYSLTNNKADIYPQHIQAHHNGYQLQLCTPSGQGKLQTQLLGRFNLSNLLAALAALLCLKIPLSQALSALSEVQAAPGRMEAIPANKALLVIDYAHTPDALTQALQALRPHCTGTLYCIFGCGGERDVGKRPQMGKIAEDFADRSVITNDNPRYEDPDAIIQDILSGMTNTPTILPERTQAIRQTLLQSQKGDVILLAGKGHEDYQDIKGQRLPFSDRQQVLAYLKSG